MPELSFAQTRRNAQAQTMARAHEMGQFIRIRCQHCNITRWYRACDLMALCGNITILDVTRFFRCEKCGQKSYLDAKLELPVASEMVGMRVRKLVRIKTIRRPVWEDIIL